jgi:hypothetical protein
MGSRERETHDLPWDRPLALGSASKPEKRGSIPKDIKGRAFQLDGGWWTGRTA